MKFTFFECPLSMALNCLGLFTEEEKDKNIVILRTLKNHKSDWEHLVPKDHYLSYNSCLANEISYPKNITARYVLIYSGTKPVFAASFQDIRIGSENIQKHKRGEFIKFATNLVLNVYDLTLLVCGNVFKDGLAGFYYDKTCFTKEEANAALLKCIEKATKQECCAAVMLKDVPEGFGFADKDNDHSFDSDISMTLSISSQWKTLDDYVKDLSKKYAARAKKILLSGASLVVKELDAKEIKLRKNELHALYKQIIQHQSCVFGALEPDFFFEMKMAFPEIYSVKGMFLDNVLVGFYSTFYKNGELEVHYVGIDYKLNSSHNLYFNIHFLALQEAILKGCTQLHMGRTSLEAKAILGCQPRYNNTYLNFLNPLAEKAFHYFKDNLSEPDTWKTRNPLKTAASLETA